jgi:hypothetical protein
MMNLSKRTIKKLAPSRQHIHTLNLTENVFY